MPPTELFHFLGFPSFPASNISSPPPTSNALSTARLKTHVVISSLNGTIGTGSHNSPKPGFPFPTDVPSLRTPSSYSLRPVAVSHRLPSRSLSEKRSHRSSRASARRALWRTDRRMAFPREESVMAGIPCGSSGGGMAWDRWLFWRRQRQALMWRWRRGGWVLGQGGGRSDVTLYCTMILWCDPQYY